MTAKKEGKTGKDNKDYTEKLVVKSTFGQLIRASVREAKSGVVKSGNSLTQPNNKDKKE